ncbi:MAG: hypothetical protein A2Y62_00985 [Candidatus Fischerbacteria bacterium RBG_13_37_8]|uniref:Cytochrome b561 bacterial/Ni-hydrogenase domain-containing protein n=1 Tax=Candidatus Fischerbacteria bacterium RBG_13_37_8 TaxID=1817863 RepID=A0A1F5VVB0_9BACT|nr:MAG: hypothetical protein A2Y62_00985 [Candidatus Fischerbacteria bacterium RBG_13_37_8]
MSNHIRFTLTWRILHILLFVSLIVLGLTGFALKYSDTSVGSYLIQLEGGIETRGLLHRISAIILMGAVCWHILYILFSKEGHRDFMKLLPARKDIHDFAQSIKNVFSKEEVAVHYDKYSYWQKVQFWVVALGTITMIATGLILWFETASMTILPKFVMDIVFVLHSDEALLIMLIIFIWHLYIVHLRPGSFPMDRVWLSGTMTVDELKKKHYSYYQELINNHELDDEK